MTALWIVGVIMALCVVVILAAVPELLAAGLAACAILVPYYLLHERHDMTDSITITRVDGALHIDTAPLPQEITIDRELWDAAPVLTHEDLNGNHEPPDGVWLEEIPHADAGVTDPVTGQLAFPHIKNAGYVFHVDAANATVAYRTAERIPAEGPITAELQTWAER